MERAFSHTLSDGRAGLPALMDALESHLRDAGVPAAVLASVMVAADEVVSNALEHSGASSIQLTARTDGGQVAVQVSDDGRPFDPTTAAAPDTGLSVEDREIGGLGIHLVRLLMDQVAYARADGTNRLRFSKAYDLVSPSKRSAGES